jgi:hypothetical protein
MRMDGQRTTYQYSLASEVVCRCAASAGVRGRRVRCGSEWAAARAPHHSASSCACSALLPRAQDNQGRLVSLYAWISAMVLLCSDAGAFGEGWWARGRWAAGAAAQALRICMVAPAQHAAGRALPAAAATPAQLT